MKLNILAGYRPLQAYQVERVHLSVPGRVAGADQLNIITGDRPLQTYQVECVAYDAGDVLKIMCTVKLCVLWQYLCLDEFDEV